MPISPAQADALFCEFMPDVQNERAWLAGSNDVRVVEVGWTPFACAVLGTLYKPPAGHLPSIWEMAWAGLRNHQKGTEQRSSLLCGIARFPRWTGTLTSAWPDLRGL
eukprot:1503316-Amphidinium_carterae.1